jgi:DNA-binding LacI/PurR family transcriptional regulator
MNAFDLSKSATASEFKILNLKGRPAQITDYLREEIQNGNLKPGVKLPSNLELAARWKIDRNTVQRAMGPLVKEGLLVRMPRVGTFIREREEKLTCVGVYNGTNVKDSAYTHAVQEALRNELHQAGIEMDVWTDPRPQEQRGEPWKALVKAAERRRFQAFIGIGISGMQMAWQPKLPLPVVFLGAPTTYRNNVGADMRQFVDASLRELAEQGCRSVGFLSPLLDPRRTAPPDGSRDIFIDMLEHFMDVVADMGLTVKNEWMRASYPDRVEAEQFGYEEFLKFWSLPEKPEGLVVFPDTVVRGMLLAVREKHVRIPEELKLVLHKNESLDVFCPMPATFLVNSEREVAKGLVEQVQQQFRGESCEPILLPFHSIAHRYPDNGK